MGDLGVNRPEDTEVVVVEVDDDDDEERENGSEVVRWERLLTRTVLRVLLVEADDSTRHIIAALLRKCNYKVAAISDGLKAWKYLKRRHSNIDLVLTELDLPSISGYALLALIMEHDGCKNIPVIIMSSQDSISMVLKCMLKGVTDFLVKPVRRNELKNLWRHVWRRLAMNVHSPQNLTTGQCKAEATFENHPATNHSSDNVSSCGKNSKVSERATDAQELSQMNHGEETSLSHKEKKHHANHIKFEEELTPDTSGLGQKATRLAYEGTSPYKEANLSSALKVAEDGSCTGMATENEIVDPDKHGHKIAEPSSEAKDLIGRINKQRCIIGKSVFNGGLNSLISSPELELSLRRSVDREIKEVDERHILNHYSASAFSWYGSNKKSQDFFPSSVGDLTEIKGAADTCAWPKAFSRNGENKLNILVAQSTHGGVSTNYGSMFQPVLNPIKGPRARSPTSAFQREESPFLTSPSLHSDPGTHSCTQGSGTIGETGNHSSGQAFHEPKNRESIEQHGCSTSLVDPSGSSSTPCDDFGKPKSSGYGSVSEVIDANPAPDTRGTIAVEESVRDNGGNTFAHDQFRSRTGHHSAEREAALAKFRLKRKGRCFEKKVRYQSRKRLAEQRPRLKGQFIRQGPSDQVLVDGDRP